MIFIPFLAILLSMERKSKPRAAEFCDVKNCEKEAYRSLSSKKVSQALSNLSIESRGRKTRLCKEHYRMYKKATKEERKLERLTW